MIRLATAGSIRVSLYFKGIGDSDVFKNYGDLLNEDVTEADLDKLETPKLITGSDGISMRMAHALSLCGESELSLITLELACFRYVNPRVAKLWERMGYSCPEGVTIEIATAIANLKGGIIEHLDEVYETYDSLGLLFDNREETADIARIALSCDYRLASFFKGSDIPDMELVNYSNLYYSNLGARVLGYEKEVNDFATGLGKLYEGFEKTGAFLEPVTVIFIGDKESGRRTSSLYTANILGINLYTVEWDFLLKHNRPKYMLNKIIRECMLSMAALCIVNIKKNDGTDDLLREIRRMADKLGNRPLFLCLEKDVKPVSSLLGRVVSFDIPNLNARQAAEVWRTLLTDYGVMADINVMELTSKMRLTIGQIQRIVALISTTEKTGHEVSTKDVYGMCYKVLDDGRYANIKRIQSGFSINDLKVSKANKEILLDICNQINGYSKVYDEWNMGKKYAYGRCVSILLAGPPGTGKTMAVHALSSELGLELYKVDLSQITDKYIGETQKRLDEVFSQAEKSNMILFFDEADAVMGKRSETKDSNDKHANGDIAFILQRIEEYDGIVILATNYLQNIDNAFMRRIKYVVNIGMPEEETRKEIWKSSFAKEVPQASDIDFDYLASMFTAFSGGNIKNVVLNATFYAAAEGTSVGMYHIMKAIYRENTKTSKGVDVFDYGKYAYLLKDI